MPSPGSADPERVAAAFEDGATIVLQGLHLNWTPLAKFCRGLEVDLGYPAQANAYYTPRGSQGFAVHHDTHDVFVLQVAGEKHWRIYDPLFELPLKHQRYSKALGEHGPPTLELTLRAGDTLYLPRGWLHDALTSETDSLHVTVGINLHTWVDALRLALDECEDDVEFRRSVPEDGAMASDLVERLAARLDADDVARRARAKLVRSRRPILDGQMEEVRELGSLTAETPLERRLDGDRRPGRIDALVRGQAGDRARLRPDRAGGDLRSGGAVHRRGAPRRARRREPARPRQAARSRRIRAA